MSIPKKLALAAILFFLFVVFTGIIVVFMSSGQISSALAMLLGFILSVAGIAHLTVDQLD